MLEHLSILHAPKAWASLRRRHHSMINVHLHFVGVILIVAAIALAVMGRYLTGVCLIVAGHCAAVIGHLTEGTPSGTGIMLRRLIGRIRRRKDDG